MRLPRVRMSVKWLMIAIAALAIVLGCSIEGIRLKRRRDAFLEKRPPDWSPFPWQY